MWKGLDLRLWIGLAGLVIMILVVGPWACNEIRSMGAQARLGEEQTQAATESGSDAVDTVGEAGQRERESDDLTEQNERRIRNAEGADDPVNPAVRDAGLAALCRRAAYRDDPRCQEGED